MYKNRPLFFYLFKAITYTTPIILGAVIITLAIFLTIKGLPSLKLSLLFGTTPIWDALIGARQVWDGLWPALIGTICLVGITLCLALLPGIGCGIYLAEYANPRQKALLGSAVDILSGTPSIVMGLFGFSLILFMRRTILPEANTGLLLSAGCLALLVLPVLIVSTRETMESLPKDLRLTATALGLNKEQRILYLYLPTALLGIVGGVILAVSRAAEDTAVIMLAGVAANAGLPASLNAKFEALPFAIYYISSEYHNQEELMHGFGAALILLILVNILIFCARFMEKHYSLCLGGQK